MSPALAFRVLEVPGRAKLMIPAPGAEKCSGLKLEVNKPAGESDDDSLGVTCAAMKVLNDRRGYIEEEYAYRG